MSIVLDSCNTFIVVLVELGTCVKSLLRREKTVMCFYHSVHYFYLRLVGALSSSRKSDSSSAHRVTVVWLLYSFNICLIYNKYTCIIQCF